MKRRNPRSAVFAAAVAMLATGSAQAADPPLQLARDGFMYVGGKTMTVGGRDFFYGQMYVEIRIPANQTHPYPIIMVHGGSMSGTNFTGTPDGREGWAQYFVRRGYAVYVVDQPGRGAIRIPDRRQRPDAQLRALEFGIALRVTGKIQAMAAGGAAHPMAGHRRARRPRNPAARHESACRQSQISTSSSRSTATH